MNIIEYEQKFNELKGQQKLTKQYYKNKNTELRESKINYEYLLKAQQIIQDVVQETQNKLKVQLTDIVNLALDSIPFPKKPDYFDMEFIVRRNQTECDLFFVQDNKQMDPVSSSGGGILDIISFGLQIACWSLQSGKKSNTIILDEPFKNLNDPNSELNLKLFVSEMLKLLSEKLKIQFIIVGSNNDFSEIGDKVFSVYLDENKKSKVKIIKDNNNEI